MNILEAIEKLDSLDSRIAGLNRAICRLESDKEFRTEVQILEEMKNEIVKERDILKDRLSKTPLTNTR